MNYFNAVPVLTVLNATFENLTAFSKEVFEGILTHLNY
jgi:hypothetical protein